MKEGQDQAYTHEIAMMIGELKATQNLLLIALQDSKAKASQLEKQIAEINNKINKAAGAIAIVTLVFSTLVQFVVGKLKGL